MKKIILSIAIIIMAVSVVQAANIGNWRGSARSWNESSFTTVKGSMINAGHNVEADVAMTAANLSNDEVFVIGEALSTPSSSELSDLDSWVRGGGILLLLTDSNGSGVQNGNNILAGINSAISITGTSPIVAPFAAGICATEGPPFNIVGQTLATSPGNEIVGGIELAGDFIHYESLGAGLVFVFGDRSDHNFFNPNSSTVNGQLFLNIAECVGQARWGRAYSLLFDPTSDQLEMMRAYRDEILSKTAKGRKYKNLLYNNSEEALEVLLENPGLIAQAKDLIAANRGALANVLKGSKGIIHNTDEIVAFLDAYANEAPPALEALAKMVKRQMLEKQKSGKLFFGFKLK